LKTRNDPISLSFLKERAVYTFARSARACPKQPVIIRVSYERPQNRKFDACNAFTFKLDDGKSPISASGERVIAQAYSYYDDQHCHV